jgi:NADH:ubiquinone oxidoreductase subunit 5 (subunit L)/multisubunit Na+/H+ antiporter MnhA subunit
MRILLSVLLSVLLSYSIIGFWTGDWSATRWSTDKSEAWKLIGGAVFLLLFFLLRNQFRKPK